MLGSRPLNVFFLLTLQLWSSWRFVAAQTQTFFPPSVPLAVRSSTFSCWLDTHNGSNPASTWPVFWNDQHILGWAGYIKVDGTAWHIWGAPVPGNTSTWLSTTITPTRTILTVLAGPMELNVTFLSPVEPSDWVRQSFPFSYVYVEGASTDGKAHSIQLYADISAEWVTNGLGTAINWMTKQTTNAAYHQVTSSAPASNFQDIAEDSTAFHAIALTAPNRQSIIGTDRNMRAEVAAPGSSIKLTDDLTGQSGTVSGGNGFPCFAHAVDLGSTATVSDIAWAVGVMRDPIVTYNGEARHGYWWSQYSNMDDAIDAFITDFPAARTRALAIDQQIMSAAGAVSQQYADLVSLATRQTMAGIELTVPLTNGVGYNTSDTLAFMKDVGNSGRVNPTEMIFSAMPALMYLNASFIAPLLEPLLRFQSSSAYTNAFAAPDLGTAYPAAPGNPDSTASSYGVENSGNMLIMVLAHARSTGDGSLIVRYYNLLKQWANYLGTNAMNLGAQTPADARDTSLEQNHGDIANLGLKGIIAIQAMSEMSSIMGVANDSQQYASTAQNLLQQWTSSTLSSGQLLWSFGQSNSAGLMYNILADKLLGLNMLPSSVYTAASADISTLSKSPSTFGLALSSDSQSFTRSGWALFSAAAATDDLTRNHLISGVHSRASLNSTSGTFADFYNVQTGVGNNPGVAPNGFATPGQGAMFSVLSLSVPNKTVVAPTQAGASGAPLGASPSSATTTTRKTNTAAIAGGVVGALAVIGLLGLAALLFYRRRQRDPEANYSTPSAPRPLRGPPSLPAMSETDTTSPPLSPPSEVGSRPDLSPMRYAQHPNPLVFTGGDTKGRGTTLTYRPTGEPLSPVGTSSVPPSVSGATSTRSGTEDLRHEMENLRQQVEHLRANQVMQEPPPMYQ